MQYDQQQLTREHNIDVSAIPPLSDAKATWIDIVGLGDKTVVQQVATRFHLRDVADHTLRLVEMMESHRDNCSDLQDLYLSTVSMRTNEVMKVLTIIATIFIPLGFIAGLYGMNFSTTASPWNMPETQWYFGYPFAIAIMLLVALAMLYYFRLKGWIGD
ncbi:CorA family divalent cation transporter [Roseimaritima ulvae]|uniref:Magnesium transport protein CorA n=1 Tax=Roseimaritima ulvae TaxID=980254 RepID=A0A5B9QXP4_9BACT|nr:CorA family divalent cation transporter [Roseimaritima ulvae]QEG42145.1 Magnesium transport protein CorA [Roseimaritima ulvae]